MAKLHDTPSDLRNDFDVHLTLHQLLGDSALGKDELFPSELMQIGLQVNFDVPTELGIWTGIVFLYRSLLRKSHVFSGEFDNHMLKRADIEITEYGLLVSVTSSKTIQCAERKVLIPICHVNGPLCAVSLIVKYFDMYQVPSDSPLLSRIIDGKLELVSYSRALMTLKRWGIRAGVKK